MSARFNAGDKVRFTGHRSMGEALATHGEYDVIDTDRIIEDCCLAVRDDDGKIVWKSVSQFEKVEPEDKDDLYVEPEPTCAHCGRTFPMHDGNDCVGDWSGVEPEPLKEGDWVQVWAQVSNPELDYDGDIAVRVDRTGKATGDRWATVWARPDAIVRPDAGQMPPWVKPARCTSLSNGHGSDVLHRCDQDEGHGGNHTAHYGAGRSWTDAEAYGRVEVVS